MQSVVKANGLQCLWRTNGQDFAFWLHVLQLLRRHLCKSEVSTKMCDHTSRRPCFSFQHLDLPTFRPTLYCSHAGQHVMMPETTEVEERLKSACLHLSRVALLVNLYFPCNSCVCVCAFLSLLFVSLIALEKKPNRLFVSCGSQPLRTQCYSFIFT